MLKTSKAQIDMDLTSTILSMNGYSLNENNTNPENAMKKCRPIPTTLYVEPQLSASLAEIFDVMTIVYSFQPIQHTIQKQTR